MSRLFAVACCLVCLASLGCNQGAKLGSVTGQVTMDGQPLANVLVTFTPAEAGRTATGKTDASGKYELICLDRKGAPVGKHKVSVTTLQEAASVAEMSSDSEEYMKQATGQAGDYNTAKVEEPIPARYNSQTEFVKEVKAGSNVIDLELTSQ
jgi:hypothetical protein